VKERKALLDALQKSLQVSEEESEAEIAMLLSDDLTDEEEQEEVVVTKRPKIQASSGKKSAIFRPRGRPPVGMQWSETQHK
jgi:trehalose-6-phosphatase